MAKVHRAGTGDDVRWRGSVSVFIDSIRNLKQERGYLKKVYTSQPIITVSLKAMTQEDILSLL